MLRYRDLLLLAPLTAAICALLLLPIHVPTTLAQRVALADDLENFGHPLVFAVLGIAVFRSLRHRWARPSLKPAIVALASSLLLGAVTEYLQAITGRDGSFEDLLGDMLGCTSAVCLQLATETRRLGGKRQLGTALFVASGFLALIATAPLAWTVAAYAARYYSAPLFWKQDSRLLKRFSRMQAGRYPGLVISEPPSDWSSYGSLVVDVVNTRPMPLVLNVRVHDRRHDESYADRFNATFAISAASATELRIPLSELRSAPHRRLMDMTSISGVAVFVTAPASRSDFQVRRLYLER